MAVGIVTRVNPRNGMFIVGLESGEYSVFENQSATDVNVGDTIRGELDAVGSEELLHVGKCESFSAFGQTGYCSLQACLLVAFA